MDLYTSCPVFALLFWRERRSIIDDANQLTDPPLLATLFLFPTSLSTTTVGMTRYILNTTSRRLAWATRRRGQLQQNTERLSATSFSHPSPWVQISGRRGLSNSNGPSRGSQNLQVTCAVLFGSALATLFLYHKTPARMDSAENPRTVRGLPIAVQSEEAHTSL